MADPDARPDLSDLLAILFAGNEERTARVEGDLSASAQVTEAIANNIRPLADLGQPSKEVPVSDAPAPTYEGEWWNDLPSVDGEPPRLSREPESIPDAEGQAYLDELAERLEARAQSPDVLEFIERNQRTEGH